MATRKARTFCRICAAHCRMVLTIEEGTDRIVEVKGDKENTPPRSFDIMPRMSAVPVAIRPVAVAKAG